MKDLAIFATTPGGEVLRSSQGCAEELPGEVEGLGCTRSVRKGAGGYEETVRAGEGSARAVGTRKLSSCAEKEQR